MIRSVQAAGGFATVLKSGDRDGGAISVVTCLNGGDSVVYERMPDAEAGRVWVATRQYNAENPLFVSDFVQMRRERDPDCWVIELDIANAARFIPGIVSNDG